MTNRIAAVLAFMIIAAIATDVVRFDGAGSVFVLRKFILLLDWLAFWR